MSNYRRSNLDGGTYFFTVVTYQRRKILCDENVRSALRNAIQKTRLSYPFDIDAWVLLPDHLHCMWTLPADDSDFSKRWAMIKRSVTKQCATGYHRDELMNQSKLKRKESTIWQRRFWEHQIHNEQDYQQHFDYIHYNPVKHAYVPTVKDWSHSSFHRHVQGGIYSADWGGVIEDIDEDEFGEP